MKSAILFIENYIAGGADKVARLLIDNLPFEKIHVFVNDSNDTSVLLQEPLPENMELTRYKLATTNDLAEFAGKFRKNMPIYYILRCLNALMRYPLIFFSVLYFYVKFARINWDIFISNNGGYPGGEYNRSAIIAAYLLRRMNVFHVIHNMALKPKHVFRPIEYVYDYFIDKFATIICVSKATDERLKNVRNIQQKVKCIYNGLESRPIKSYGKNAIAKILNVGSLDQRKNQVLLLKALGRMVSRGFAGFEVYFVGKEAEDGYLERLKGYVKDFQLEDRVFFEGFQKNPEPYYENCDIFVLSSQVESLPIVILEAMRVGMPVIATDVGGVREEVTDGINGFIVKPDDDRMLAEKLKFLLKYPDKLEKMGRNGYRSFEEKFTLNKMRDEYSRLFGLKVPVSQGQIEAVLGR
jgi:glycosyltransferase involved in cell wall biosynthesis